MHNAEFTPELSGLDKDYQILTELHQSADSRIFLARHLRLNRDVTITVIHAATAESARTLARFEADVTRLTTLRHPNVIPVIEGRRLAADQFAVIRARVRGSSLDQLVSAVGPIPVQRVGSILDQVRSALEWAAANGLSDRHVAQDSMIFQQGSGRVLISFEPAPGTDGLPADPCEDARTIGSLGWEMLSAQRLDDPALKPLTEMRPDLSRAIVAETNALVHCWRGGPPRDIAAYVAMLTASPPVPPVGPTRETPAFVPITPPPLAPPPPPPPRIAAPRVTMMHQRPTSSGWHFNVRVASAVAFIVVLVALGYFILHRDRGHVVGQTAVSSSTVAGGAAGDVVATQRDSTAADSASSDSAALSTKTTRHLAAPATRRHEPPRTHPPASFPRPD